MLPRPRAAIALVLALGIGVGLSGCTPAVDLDPAPHATAPACAAVVVALPAEVDGQAIRQTDAQATGAWGDPASVILHCGVPVPGPSDLPCITTPGDDPADPKGTVYWIEDDSKGHTYVFTTYGRDPAVQVALDDTKVSGSSVLSDLQPAVSTLPLNGRRCISVSDVDGGSGSAGASPAPAPPATPTPVRSGTPTPVRSDTGTSPRPGTGTSPRPGTGTSTPAATPRR